MTDAEAELKLFQIAQEITDAELGPGSYVALNHFDPSKGETRQPAIRERQEEGS